MNSMKGATWPLNSKDDSKNINLESEDEYDEEENKQYSDCEDEYN